MLQISWDRPVLVYYRAQIGKPIRAQTDSPCKIKISPMKSSAAQMLCPYFVPLCRCLAHISTMIKKYFFFLQKCVRELMYESCLQEKPQTTLSNVATTVLPHSG